MADAQYKTRISLADTLRNLDIGESFVIKNSEFKRTSIANAAYRLKKENVILSVSDAGRIDDVIVTRVS
jgi:hypothetical protein